MQLPVSNPGYVIPENLINIHKLVLPVRKRINKLIDSFSPYRLIDVGCGPGFDDSTATIPIRKNGFLIGVDYDKSIILEASRLAKNHDTEYSIIHISANA